MIIAYTGLAGSGKTYHMTQIALKLIEQGKIVFSRHELEGAYPILDEREMLRMRDCHVFFDEWHQDHSAKEWWNLDEVLKHMVTQSRKYSMIIHWSAQHWLYMDSFIRRNTDYVWEHQAKFRDPDTGESRIGWHRAKKIAGIEAELRHRNPKILATKNIWIKKNIYQKYDSFKPLMISKAKLSDEEINAIADPYSREKTHISKRKGESISYLPSDHSENLVSNFEREEDRLNSYVQAKNSEEVSHRQELPDNL